MKNIANGNSLSPKELWNNFDNLLGIPHPSGKEKKLA